jgi:hypothetical protein
MRTSHHVTAGVTSAYGLTPHLDFSSVYDHKYVTLVSEVNGFQQGNMESQQIVELLLSMQARMEKADADR